MQTENRANPREAALSLLSASAVRERAHELLMLGLDGKLAHFTIDRSKTGPTADLVASVIRENYPGLKVPLHARWRHFVFGGKNLGAVALAPLAGVDKAARARAAFDLAIVSVLLDAGAGATWRYTDKTTGITANRSEGLALASLRMFEAGLFSSDAKDPLRADASKLAALTGEGLAQGFQVSNDNPMAGLDGRAALLARLGRTMRDNPATFAQHDSARAGGLFDVLAARGDTVEAADILRVLLVHFGPIWTGRLTLEGVPLGDTWKHSAIKRDDVTNGLMPLHKLSQWLSYSLIEPLRDAGLVVSHLDALTGLAEYRNGGLFLDGCLLIARDPSPGPYNVDQEKIVEWRALTVALLDTLHTPVRERLGLKAEDFPLGALLEGGTWAAGRKLARVARTDSSPPLNIVSDGTVF